MFQGYSRTILNRITLAVAVTLLATTTTWAASYKILHSFSGQLASNPSSGLVLDKAGNAYGATAAGGFNKAGAVYKLSPKTGFHVIYGFSGSDGRQPQGNLAVDADGNLYGTTVYGGANESGCGNKGCGTVFKLSPPVSGNAWTETVLYSFSGADDGANPQAGVILDAAGNVYGTTMGGGSGRLGVVFQLHEVQGGLWAESLLHSFVGGPDGGNPESRLVFDGSGNLYGTAEDAGPTIGGTVFELSPNGDETWTYLLLYAFDGRFGSRDANGPIAGLTFDTASNLFGTTGAGGEFGFGTVFRLTLNGSGWTESVLYSFAGGSDGATPMATVVFDAAGNLYGTTFAGGTGGFACLGNGCGTVFELVPANNGQWTERRFVFPKNGSLGLQPTAPLLLDQKGNIYGTTTEEGPLGEGIIFRITP